MSSLRLRTRLVRAFILAAALPLLLNGLLVSEIVFASLRQEIHHGQRETALTEARRISTFMLEIQHDLEGLGEFIVITNGDRLPPASLREALFNFVRRRQAYREISLMDAGGQEIARVARSGPLPDDALVRRDEEEKFFRAARGQVFYSWVRFDASGPYLSLSAPVFTDRSNSQLKYVVSADIDLTQLWNEIQAIQVGQGGYAFLAGQRGNLIAYRDPKLARSNLSLATCPPVRDVLVNSTPGAIYEYRGLNGQNVIGVGAPIDGPRWVIVIERPLTEAYASAFRSAATTLILAIGACLLAVVAGTLVSRRITQPVALLKEEARRLGSGENSHRLTVRTGDEIQDLAEEFNRMADSLEQFRAENLRLYEQAQQRARELAAALQKQQELDQLKNEFIQNTSHELRTPLTLIRGYIELLAAGDLGEISPDQREAITIIQQRTTDLTSIVDGLTALLEAESGAMVCQEVSLQELACQAVSDLETAASKRKQNLRLEISEPLPPVQADVRHLRRVIDHLLVNALKFTPPGGDICVQAQAASWEGAPGVRVQVSDTGIGIPADKLDHVFERFYQVNGSTRRRYGGVGLGLALVKEIVQAHGGQVGIASEVGRGTTVWFWLPSNQPA